MFINLFIQVGSAIATLLGVTADTVALSDAVGWSSLGSEHPLYSTDTASPKIDITATKESFTLTLVQPNEIGETVDDESITLRGTAYENVTPGVFRQLWSYDLTYTYDHVTFGISRNNMFVSGTVKHIVAPHLEDDTVAPALKVDNLLTAPLIVPSPPINISANGLLSTVIHPPNHRDRITQDKLTARVGTPFLGNWYNWSHELKAVHEVPGPLPIFGAAAAFGYSRKLRKRIKEAKPEVISTTAV
jgi:hypothetical protein